MAVLSFILVFVVAVLLIPPGINIEASRGVMGLSVNLNNQPPPPLSDIYPVGEEVVEKRTANSKTHYLGGNKYSVDSSLSSIHYDDGSTWQNIDNQFTMATPPWDWQMVNDSYQTFALNDFTAGQVLKFQTNGESVTFQPMALEWTNDNDQIEPISMPQDVDSATSNPIGSLLPGTPNGMGKIKWYDGYGEGINFSWQNTPGRLNKLLEIESFANLSIPLDYIVNGGNPMLRLSFIFTPSKDLDIYIDGQLWDKKSLTNTLNSIEFKDGGDALWKFLSVHCWDSGIEFPPQGTTQLRKVGNSLYVSVMVSYSWLQTATYPVYIDPSVSVGASADDIFVWWSGSAWGRSITDIGQYVGYISSSLDKCGGGMIFRDIDMPVDATIDTANITMTARNNFGNVVVNSVIIGELTNSPDVFSSAADYQARRGTIVDGADDTHITTEYQEWNSIIAWTTGTTYESPDFALVIQEIVDNSWLGDSTDNISIFWDDHAGTSDAEDNHHRGAASWDNVSYNPPLLNIVYIVNPTASNAPDSHSFGILDLSAHTATGMIFNLTNTGGVAIDVNISGQDLTGGDDTWTLSDTATPGSNTYGLLAGISSYNVTVKKNSPFIILITNLATSANQTWGLDLYMPTGTPGYDGQVMSGNTTLIITAH